MNVDELIDDWESAWSSRDPAAFDHSCLPGVHYEDPVTSEPLEGIDELRRHAERLWAAFPDARLEPTGDRLTNGRFVAAPAKLLATQKGPLEGLPASNKFVIVHCVFYCELAGDRLYGERALLMLRGFGLRAGRG
jgi:hypothetical protein